MSNENRIQEMIKRAYHEHWAIGQFNISNLETMMGVISAAEEKRSPVLLGISNGTIRHLGYPYIEGLVRTAEKVADIPLWFHLDHGKDFETVKNCVNIGFRSVMIDTSILPLKENIEQVIPVVHFCKSHGIGVEAQIGVTWDEETGDESQEKTNPEEVKIFVESTDIDYLAFSFGNTPGRLSGYSNPDIKLLKEIADKSQVPIVMHGGTSVPDPDITISIGMGVSKINIDTLLRRAITDTFLSFYPNEASAPGDPRIAFKAMRDEIAKRVGNRMELFGSAGRV